MHVGEIRNGDLTEVARMLNERRAVTEDFVVPASQLGWATDGLRLQVTEALGMGDGGPQLTTEYDVTRYAQRQLAARLDIPGAYWDRMAGGHFELLADNVNHWLADSTARYFVRALRDVDGGTGLVRALLSDRYRPLDDLDMLLSALEGIQAAGLDPTTVRTTVDLTERKMVARIEAPEIQVLAPELLAAYRDPRTGASGRDYPVVSAGICLTNSEVGDGSWTISPRVVVLVCKNGMTRPADAIRKTHIGGKLTEGPVVWSDDTQQQRRELVKLEARDAVKSFLNVDYLQGVIAEAQALADVKLAEPTKVLEKVGVAQAYTQAEQDAILGAFVAGGDVSAWGVTQAVTYVAQQVERGDRAHELENSALRAGTQAAQYATAGQ
jgi:hypothetical protein